MGQEYPGLVGLGYGSSVKRYSPREIAHLAGTCARTIRRACKRGELAAYKLGQYWYVPGSEVQRWIASDPQRFANAERAIEECRLRGVSLSKLRPLRSYERHRWMGQNATVGALCDGTTESY